MCKCVYVWVYVFHRAHSVCEGGAAGGEERRRRSIIRAMCG